MGIQINRIKVVLVEQKRTSKWIKEQLGITEAIVIRRVSNKTQTSIKQFLDIARVLNVDI